MSKKRQNREAAAAVVATIQPDATQVLAEEIGMEDPTPAEVAESNDVDPAEEQAAEAALEGDTSEFVAAVTAEAEQDAAETAAETTSTLASQLAQATQPEAAPAAPTVKHYGGKVVADLPPKWAAFKDSTIQVENPIGIARAIARYGSDSVGGKLYALIQKGGTVQDWADSVKAAGMWDAVGLLSRSHTQHPTLFLNAAIRNKWVKLVAPVKQAAAPVQEAVAA